MLNAEYWDARNSWSDNKPLPIVPWTKLNANQTSDASMKRSEDLQLSTAIRTQ